jgi:hypothetical protein
MTRHSADALPSEDFSEYYEGLQLEVVQVNPNAANSCSDSTKGAMSVMSLLNVMKCVEEMRKHPIFQNPDCWTVAYGSLTKQPVEEVKLGFIAPKSMWFDFKYDESGAPHTLHVCDNVFSGKEDEAECDGKTISDPHVNMNATTYGPSTLAFVIKCAFQCDGKASFVRFDGHFPSDQVGDVLLNALFQ